MEDYQDAPQVPRQIETNEAEQTLSTRQEEVLAQSIPKTFSMPDWLLPTKQPSNRELLEQRFEIAFERLLDFICEGCTLEGAVAKYAAYVDPPLPIGSLNSWIQRDRARRKAYEDAKEYRSEVWAGRAMRIAEGTSDTPDALPEDVARSRLRVDTIMKLIGADNRRVYAPSQQVDLGTNTVSILAALAAARSRADASTQGLTIEHQSEPRQHPQAIEQNDQPRDDTND